MSLVNFYSVIWQRKSMIIIITMLAASIAVILSLLSIRLPPEKSFAPDVYTPKTLMIINDKSSSAGSTALALFLVKTNSFLDLVIDEFNLIEKYEINKNKSPKSESRKKLKKLLRAEFDKSSEVLSIAFTDRDPVFAKDVADYCAALVEKRLIELGFDKNLILKENLELKIANTTQEITKLEEERDRLEQFVVSSAGRSPDITADMNRINTELNSQKEIYTQLLAQRETLEAAIAIETPLIQILETAEVPDQKSGPNRGLICIIVIFAALLFSVFTAFTLNAISNIRKDPEAMAKIRGNQEKRGMKNE